MINEIMADPEGKDSENEWVELYNPNDFAVDLSGWQIKDGIGRTRAFFFDARTFDRTKIEPFGFVLCPIDKTKISLNNTGDIVELLDPQNQTADKVEYPKAKQGQTYSRFASDWQWAQPSPEKPNILPQLTTKNPTKQLIASTSSSGQTQNNPQAASADIQQNIKQTQGPKTNNLLWFIAAIAIAGLSTAIAILLSKKGHKK